MPDTPLSKRIAVVTGGESGIGAACAAALAAAGSDVAIFYYSDTASADAGVKAAEQHGVRATAVQVDVTKEESVEAGFDAVAKTLGVPDILVNSAGLNMSGVPVSAMTLAQWERLLGTDLTGSFLTSRRFAQNLEKAKRPAAIINITSVHAFAVRAGGADYCSAKAGQLNLTRTMAIEVAANGITVNAIAPGMIETPMNSKVDSDQQALKSADAHIPMGRPGRADEVAGVAVFLASPAAAYITGTEIVIDGGLSLMQALGA